MTPKIFVKKVRTRLFGPQPNLPSPFLPDPTAPHANGQTLIIAVDPSFDKNATNAGTMIKTGFARGWAQVCGPAIFANAKKLVSIAEQYSRPAIFLSIYDFNWLSESDLKTLRGADCFVWISIHPTKIEELVQKIMTAEMGPDLETWKNNYKKVLLLEPKFVWNSCSQEGLHWYEGWIKDGLKWETIHPAADESLYFPEPNPDAFGQIEMAYVGGYWAEKAQAFDKYLRPWEDKIHVYGYAQWPYKRYGGRLTEKEERQLYSTAKIIPIVTTPAGWVLTEITERYFKAPACKAFCIMDENLAAREIYTPEEALMVQNDQEFHEVVNAVLKGEIDTRAWRERTYNATLQRHCYKHRALQIKRALSG